MDHFVNALIQQDVNQNVRQKLQEGQPLDQEDLRQALQAAKGSATAREQLA